MRLSLHRLLAAALVLLLSVQLAQAQIVNTLPYQLQNGTTADASQVMADFNQIVNNVNSNGAKNGANSDITSITGLTTPLTQAQGGTPVYTGTSAGTANAQTILVPSPTGFTLTNGRRVTFLAGASNSGPMTLNVASTGVLSVYQLTATGLVALSGGEVQSGTTVDVVYNSTIGGYQLMSQASSVPVGMIADSAGISAPSGWLFSYGQAVSRTTYANLFSVVTATLNGTTTNGSAIVTGISSTSTLAAGFAVCGTGIASGSTILSVDSSVQVTLSLNATGSATVSIVFAPYGCGDNSTTFNLPDLRARTTVAPDAMGGSAASRITTAGSSCNAASLGTACSTQNVTLSAANVPQLAVTITDPGHTHRIFGILTNKTAGGDAIRAMIAISGTGDEISDTTTTGITATANTASANTPVARLTPLLVVNKIIKY